MFSLRIIALFLVLDVIALAGGAQELVVLHEKAGISLRGLSVVNDRVLWASGSDGHVGRSTDGARTWWWGKVAGYETRDFRDIEAFSSSTAIIMAIGEPALILKTTNGGETWRQVYENNRPGMFLDAMDFLNSQTGVVIGDPIHGKFFIARTEDGGDTWQEMPPSKLPFAQEGEACFAASGTNIRMLSRSESAFVSGGPVTRLFQNYTATNLSMLSGRETQGANSLAVWKKKNDPLQIAIVGGDFTRDSSRTGNALISKDGGKTWIRPSNPPYGYRSCVIYVSAEKLVACGINGVDVSLDEGINWNSVSKTGFHVCAKAKTGNTVFLAGSGGRIARLDW